MVYLYKSVNPKKLSSPPKIVFKLAVDTINPSNFFYGTFGRGLNNDLWNTGVGNYRGVIAILCPLNLKGWDEE